MNNKTFKLGQEIESNTYYTFNEKRLDIYIEDTIFLPNSEFYCVDNRCSENHKTAIYVNKKENVVLDFNGATLYLHGDIQPFIINESKNIEIKNVSVKYDRSFFTEMTLIEKGDNYLKVKIDPRFPYEVFDGEFFPKSDYWKDETIKDAYVFLQEFDPVTHEGLSWPVISLGKKDLDKLTLPWGDETCALLAYQEGEYVYFRGNKVPDYHVGSILELCMNNRDISAVTFYDCEDCKITNFRIVNGLGMGILPMYCKNVTIDGLKMFFDEESIGIISNTADGVHADACSGDFIIKNSLITATIDDALNIHSNYFETVDYIDDELIVRRALAAKFDKVFAINDEIGMYKNHTMELIDNFTIKGIRQLDHEKYAFTLDKKVNNFVKNSLIENLSTQPNIYIDNCTFGKANTHLRFQSRGKIRVNNITTSMDLLFTGDTNYWFESSPVNDVIIENSKFEMNKFGVVSIPEFKASESSPYYHRNIEVRNCTFTSDLAMYMRFTDDMRFYDCVNKDNKPFKVHLDHCGSFTSNLNVDVKRTNEKGDRDE